MEIPEEVEMCNKDHTQIMKGKRTKRQRPSSPTCSSGFDLENTSPTTSADFRDSTQEEEDMANCLILLAQGRTARKASDPVLPPPDLYQCKTCNRCFPSFQALGGHRASHKKSDKLNTDPEKQAVTFVNDSYDPSLSLRISNSALYSSTGKSKVHECSICGAEFSSGQALGGHMRRHRTFVNASTSSPESQEAKKRRSVLKLDLNLPAPEDDPREPKFTFQPKPNALVFSASSLVDCHY